MRLQDALFTRREMLERVGMGMGALAMAPLLSGSTAGSAGPTLPGKAKRVVHLFMNGGPSHEDTFDPKPSLAKYSAKPIP
ncbi:MAG: DUF1501 domain-containing protein, partial [Acidobacteriota bacterium]|nr:DUF1501 domain-containing protein [Acidobacteriota bacterium]